MHDPELHVVEILPRRRRRPGGEERAGEPKPRPEGHGPALGQRRGRRAERYAGSHGPRGGGRRGAQGGERNCEIPTIEYVEGIMYSAGRGMNEMNK